MNATPLEYLPDAPDLFHVYRRWAEAPGVARAPGGWRYQGRFYPDYLCVGGASFAIARAARRWCEGHGIDIGAGLWPLPGAIPVDLARGPGVGRTVDDFPAGTLDFVFSSHTLEHVAAWREELARWVTRLRAGGILFLYLPHPECALWHPGSPFVGDDHRWQPTPDLLRAACAELGLQEVAADDGPDAMMSFHLVARRTVPL